MTDPETKVRSFLLVVLVVVGTIPAATVAPVAAAAAGNDAGNTPGDGAGNAPDTFHVQQADQCYEVGTLGDGSTSVEDFYDYRNNETHPDSEGYWTYSSFGTTHLQDNQESKLLVYDGSGGYSLVVLHDKFPRDGGNGSYGSTVTFQLSGVGDSTWVVKDDHYADGNQDDNWNTGNTHDIDWKWSGDRNDGGALDDIADKSITIDPGFNENADAWDSWKHAGNDKNEIDDWEVIDEVGEYHLEQSLDKTESVTIDAGTCSAGSGPSADLTASPNPANTGKVTLDASGSTDEDGDISKYHWDFDGDGRIDERTDTATTDHTYATAGNHEATVIVVDDAHKQDTASTTVEVKNADGGDDGDDGDGDPGDGGDTNDNPPEAAVSVPDEAPLSQPLWIDASNSTDDEGIVWYKYYVDGELLWAGNPDSTPEETSAQPWKASQFPNGADTYRVTVKVWDNNNQSDKASNNVTIKRTDDTKPHAEITVEGTTKVDKEVTFEATDFTKDAADTLTHISWKFDGQKRSDGQTWTTTFQDSGQKTVTLVLEDRAGNYNEVQKTIHVDSADSGDGGDDSPEHGDDPFEDPDNRDSRSGGIPGANPDDEQSDDERPLDDAPRNVSENLTDDDGRFGTVVVSADDGSEVTVEVYDTAPSGIPAPTPARDGFEAVSFLTADGADRATVTVASARLDRLDATPEDVSLFRYENGTWTAVETTVANATGDTYQFRANVTNGTYAVGVERPVIGVTDVNVQNRTVAPGEAATVAVTVENAGLANGTDEVTLAVGGDAVATETVSLSAGGWTTLRFAPTFASAGTYEVTVGDATAEIVVESVETETTTTTSPEDPATETTTTTDESTGSIPGFGVGVALVALLASALLALRRR